MSFIYGECADWTPKNSTKVFTVTPYQSITYSLGTEEEDIGDITITNFSGEIFIESIYVNTYIDKELYKQLLVEYVQSISDKNLYINPKNSIEIQWLAELGFEPVYLDDWSPNSKQAPWERGYKEMMYVIHPTLKELSASYEKRFLMALSNYVEDINDIKYKPTIKEFNNVISINWTVGNKELNTSFNKSNINSIMIINLKDGTVLSSKVFDYTYKVIQIMAEWLISDILSLPILN